MPPGTRIGRPRGPRSTRPNHADGLSAVPRLTPPMSSLAQRTIATIGSGVMAEAIIAGLLRGQLVEPHRIVASHPRADRREAPQARPCIPTADSNATALAGAHPPPLALTPHMPARPG